MLFRMLKQGEHLTQDQTAILVEDHGKWVLVIESDDDESGRAWKNIDAAIWEFTQEGWRIVKGSSPIPNLWELNTSNRGAIG